MIDTIIQEKIVANAREAARFAAFYEDRWRLEWLGIGKFHRVRAALIEHAVREYCQHNAIGKILDVGCGFGWLSLFLAKYGTYIGVDFAQRAIGYARCVYREFGSFIVADAEDPFLGLSKEIPFDIVIASEVIEHVKYQDAFLAQINRFTKLNGFVILTTPNGYLLDTAVRKYGNQLQPIENWITPPELHALLTTSGFQVVQHVGIVYRDPIYSWRSYLISGRLRRLFGSVGLGGLYESILLQNCIYQFILPASTGKYLCKGTSS